DQAARSVEQARQQLANLKAPAKPTEIFQAEANLAEALAAADRARADFDRAQALAGTGAVTPQILDQRRADYQSAEAKVKALEAALANLRAPMGREAEIKAQEAAVRAAEAALEAAEWRLSQRRVSAPAAGKVADVLARPGETVAAGFAVVSLLPPENIFVRFFVPEPELARVQRGEPVGLVCDNCPTDLSATIAFVSPKAEYTPPVIYSESSRAKLVYMIEARPAADQARLLNPGQPIDVRPVRAARPP
ncbi:MAG: HlyD family secretion protein, partial [Xanthobacteraceae bacterium]